MRVHELSGLMLRAGIALLVALTLLGCGKKGPPVAPERRIPVAVSDLSAVVEGPAVVLTWSNPGTRADGTRLKDLTTIRIYRREDAGDGEPKPAMLSWGKVVGYDEIAAIRLAEPDPATVEGPRATWADREKLTVGRRYVYVRTAMDSIGRSSPPSPRVVVNFLAAPRPPDGLTATAGEGEARLAWAAPAHLVDGSPAPPTLGYEVLRAPSAAGPFAPGAPEAIAARDFTDRGLTNGQTYYYAVRAVRTEPGGRARSTLSAVAGATPVDLTPPSPPGSLVAVPAETAVRLAWNASPEEDVAGYLVYRAEAPGTAYVRLTPASITTTTYIDRTVERGKTYSYVVTAVDRAIRPNESARSQPAGATVP
ncbi:MAG: fibronectin type III domain-containing protein [candidate division NC10 bacterium]